MIGNQRCVSMVINQEEEAIHRGVPLESVLVPILRILYINDIHKCINYSDTFGFAEDTNLLNISEDYKTLQNNVNRDLISLHEWLLANKISLNNDKPELIYIHQARSKIPTDLNIKIYHSNQIKYFGIYVDDTLMVSGHCEKPS